ALDAGGNALLAEIEQLITSFSPYSDEREELAAALYGTSETLNIDGEGRVILSERLKAHAGITDAVAFVGLGHKFQIWEPERFRRPAGGGPRKGARAQRECGPPGGGARCAGSREMMTGRDPGSGVAGGPARHIPVLGRAAVELLNVRPGRLYLDATFGAG